MRHNGGVTVLYAVVAIGVVIAIALLAMMLAWRYTPLSGVASPENVISQAKSFGLQWWAPLWIEHWAATKYIFIHLVYADIFFRSNSSCSQLRRCAITITWK